MHRYYIWNEDKYFLPFTKSSHCYIKTPYALYMYEVIRIIGVLNLSVVPRSGYLLFFSNYIYQRIMKHWLQIW